MLSPIHVFTDLDPNKKPNQTNQLDNLLLQNSPNNSNNE